MNKISTNLSLLCMALVTMLIVSPILFAVFQFLIGYIIPNEKYLVTKPLNVYSESLSISYVAKKNTICFVRKKLSIESKTTLKKIECPQGKGWIKGEDGLEFLK